MTPDPPDWASLLGADGYARFRRALLDEIARIGLVVDPDHVDCGVLHTPAGHLGLTNLVRLCHQADPERWPDVIAEHVRRCTMAPVDSPFELAAPRLRLRLLPDRHLTARPEGYVSRPLASDLHVALAQDKPEHVVFVHPRELGGWGQDADALFELATTNTRAEPPLAVEAIDVEGGLPVHALFGDSYFAASQALFLEAHVPGCADGHLVAVPDRHAVLALPLADARALGSLGFLVRLAHVRFIEEPGAITDQLYWRRGETWVRVACGVRADGQPWVAPPDAFNDLVVRLGK